MLDADLWNNHTHINYNIRSVTHYDREDSSFIGVWRMLNGCFDSSMSSSPSNSILQSVPCPETLSVWLLSYVLSGGGWHRWASGRYDRSGKRSSLLLQGSAKTVSCIRCPLLAPFDLPWHTHTQIKSCHFCLNLFSKIKIFAQRSHYRNAKTGLCSSLLNWILLPVSEIIKRHVWYACQIISEFSFLIKTVSYSYLTCKLRKLWE